MFNMSVLTASGAALAVLARVEVSLLLKIACVLYRCWMSLTGLVCYRTTECVEAGCHPIRLAKDGRNDQRKVWKMLDNIESALRTQ